MIFPVNHPFYDVTIDQSKKENYHQQVNEVEIKKFVTQYYFEKNPTRVMCTQLEDVGFKKNHVELREMNFRFENVDEIQSKKIIIFEYIYIEDGFTTFIFTVDSFRAILPFKLSEEIKLNFERECTLKIAEGCSNVDGGLNLRYTLMIVFSSKWSSSASSRKLPSNV